MSTIQADEVIVESRCRARFGGWKCHKCGLSQPIGSVMVWVFDPAQNGLGGFAWCEKCVAAAHD